MGDYECSPASRSPPRRVFHEARCHRRQIVAQLGVSVSTAGRALRSMKPGPGCR